MEISRSVRILRSTFGQKQELRAACGDSSVSVASDGIRSAHFAKASKTQHNRKIVQGFQIVVNGQIRIAAG